MGCAGQTSPIHGGSTSQLTGLKGSATDGLVPDTTADLQRSNGVHALTGQEDLLNIREVVIMLWLIGGCWATGRRGRWRYLFAASPYNSTV